MHHMHQYVPGHVADTPIDILSAGDLLTCERESNLHRRATKLNNTQQAPRWSNPNLLLFLPYFSLNSEQPLCLPAPCFIVHNLPTLKDLEILCAGSWKSSSSLLCVTMNELLCYVSTKVVCHSVVLQWYIPLTKKLCSL